MIKLDGVALNNGISVLKIVMVCQVVMIQGGLRRVKTIYLAVDFCFGPDLAVDLKKGCYLLTIQQKKIV